ncbi:hypothetical protein HNR76_003056, partial [Pseudoxanthomonas broegbernensis]|nr:hypothetical protein [Pseudoxanthomonas broegbernensis]
VTELQQEGLKEIFDAQKVAERMEMGQVAGEVGFQAVGDFSSAMKGRAEAALDAAKKNGDPTAITAAQVRVDGWSEGGTHKVVLHSIVGAGVAVLGGSDGLEGLAGAGLTQMALPKMIQVLRDNGIDPTSAEGSALLLIASAAIGGAVGGSTGAGVATSATANNWLLHAEREELMSAQAQCALGDAQGCQRAQELDQTNRRRDAEMLQYVFAESGTLTLSQYEQRVADYFESLPRDEVVFAPYRDANTGQFEWTMTGVERSGLPGVVYAGPSVYLPGWNTEDATSSMTSSIVPPVPGQLRTELGASDYLNLGMAGTGTGAYAVEMTAESAIGMLFGWGDATRYAKGIGAAAAWGGVLIEGGGMFLKNEPITGGDLGHLGVTSGVTYTSLAVGGLPGVAIGVTWAGLDTVAQSQHYTPVFGELTGVEVSGWKAMRAMAIDNREFGARRIQAGNPEYSLEEAKNIYDMQEMVRKLERARN